MCLLGICKENGFNAAILNRGAFRKCSKGPEDMLLDRVVNVSTGHVQVKKRHQTCRVDYTYLQRLPTSTSNYTYGKITAIIRRIIHEFIKTAKVFLSCTLYTNICTKRSFHGMLHCQFQPSSKTNSDPVTLHAPASFPF